MQSIYIQTKEEKPYQLMQKKKAFDKLQYLFMTNSQQVRRGDELPQFDKVYLQKIYSKHHINDDSLDTFPLRSRTSIFITFI